MDFIVELFTGDGIATALIYICLTAFLGILLGKVSIFNKNDEHPYSAGNGAILSVNPCGFIVNDEVTGVKVISVKEEPIEKIIDKTSDVIINAIKKD